MENLDVKDKKILHQLELDSRQSFSSIAKKVGLSREVVSYRIKQLEEKGIVDKYILILNSVKIGYESFKWYLQLENVDNEKLMVIIQEFKEHPYCGWVTTCTGRWDLIGVFLVVSPLHFKEISNQFLLKYNKYIRETSFTIELDVYHFKKKYLWEEKLKFYETPYFGGETEKTALGMDEIKILIELCENPRQNVIDIARKTKLSVDIVRYRIEKMEDSGLIQGSRIQVNNAKLGYESYKILLNTKFISKEKELSFVDFLGHNKNVWDVIHCLGNWNMEINVDVENSAEFHNFIMDIKNRFPEIIKGYDSIQVFDNYKHSFFPMGKVLLKKSEK